MQKTFWITGSIILIVLVICVFNKNRIIYLYNSKLTEVNYAKQEENEYKVDYHFNYIKENDSLEIANREDIIPEIYYSVNSGVHETKKYCGLNYDNCFQDVYNIIYQDEKTLIINNYVHPFNSFDSIKVTGHNKVVTFEIGYIYSKEEIEAVNNVVSSVMKEKISDDMDIRDKIKVIHDYIIDNTDYDELKSKDINDDTYRSNTAYGVLIQGYGICSGYADAMAVFLDEMGIVNYKISNDKHIWNLVYLDGNWYHLDLTWDDPVSDTNINRSTYFLIDTKALSIINDGVHYFDFDIFSEAKLD